MKSLFAQYSEERFSSQTIEESWGFITFRLSGEICMIQDQFIIPEERGTGRGKKLLEQAAQMVPEAKHFWSQVCISDSGANETLQKALHIGFQMIKAEENRIILMKEIVR